MSLAWVGQDDFAIGILRSSGRGAEPGGAITIRNGLLDDDGDVYRRGGDYHYSTNAADGPITFVWSGYLNDLPRTLVATATKTYSFTGGVLTVLGATGIPRPVLPAIVGEKLYLPGGKVWDGGVAMGSWASHAHVASIADRLVYADGNRVAFSEAGNPASFLPDDYHELPGGLVVVGMTPVRDTLLVFTNYGLWSINNMSFDLTDELGNVQQTMQRIVPEISLLSASGLCDWEGRIVAPCADRILLVDTVNPVVPISDSITPMYMKAVREGYKPGGAKVFRNHLFLPMLGPTPGTVALFVCRLNRPIRGRLTYFPWSTFDGHAGANTCFDFNLLGAAPKFIGGNLDGRLADLTDVFDPSELNPSDAVGTHEFELETRDYVTGNGQPNHIRRLRLYYTLRGSGQIEAAYSTGTIVQTYEVVEKRSTDYADAAADYPTFEQMLRGGETSAVTTPDDPERWWAGLPLQAFQSAGIDPVNWNFEHAERTRFIRAWFRCTHAVDRLTIHRLEFGVRPATHQR